MSTEIVHRVLIKLIYSQIYDGIGGTLLYKCSSPSSDHFFQDKRLDMDLYDLICTSSWKTFERVRYIDKATGS